MNVVPIVKMVYMPSLYQTVEQRSYDAFIRLANGGVLLVNDEKRGEAITKLLLALQRDIDKEREVKNL